MEMALENGVNYFDMAAGDAAPFTAHFDAQAGRATDLITGAPHDFGGGSELPPCSVRFWRTE